MGRYATARQKVLELEPFHSRQQARLCQSESFFLVTEEAQVRTTEDELHGYYIVKAILSQLVDPERVFMRDQKSYCSVLLDDSNRKQICRLWFNSAQKYVGLFDVTKNEVRTPIQNLSDIYKLSDQLKETVRRFELKPPGDGATPANAAVS